MKNKNVVIAGLAGGLVFFILSWLIYGVLLNGYGTHHTLGRDMWDIRHHDLASIILVQLIWGFVVAKAFSWSFGNPTNFLSGVRRGAILGFLTASAIDIAVLGFSALSEEIVDIMSFTMLMAATGGIVAMKYHHDGEKEKASPAHNGHH